MPPQCLWAGGTTVVMINTLGLARRSLPPPPGLGTQAWLCARPALFCGAHAPVRGVAQECTIYSDGWLGNKKRDNKTNIVVDVNFSACIS